LKSTSEVIREGLRLRIERQDKHQAELETLKRAWADGVASGIAGPFDMVAILKDARKADDDQ
jgi:antitoxin ParD1/3/4